MNSRERVLSALNFKEADKVPVDLGSNPSSGISAIAYANLVKYLGMDHLPTLIYDVVQQLAQPDDAVLDLLGVDAIDMGRTYNTRESDWQEVSLADGQKAYHPLWFKTEHRQDGYVARDSKGEVIARMPDGATFFDQTVFPYQDGYPSDFNGLGEQMDRVLWSAFAHSPWDHSHQPGFWDDLRARSLKLKEQSDRALVIVVGCNLFEWGTFLRRIDNFLTDLFLFPSEVEALLDKLMEFHLQTLEKVIESVGDIADVLRFGDDLGMSSGPFMAPETYQQFFKPRHTILNDYVKSNSNMKTLLHCCGSIYQLIPDLIEAGYDILNPVQTNTYQMDPVVLKQEFGKEISFWGGGCETAGMLNSESPETIRRHVLERMEIFSKGGGFVFNPVHNILPDVPPENIIAAFNAVKEFNGDPQILHV